MSKHALVKQYGKMKIDVFTFEILIFGQTSTTVSTTVTEKIITKRVFRIFPFLFGQLVDMNFSQMVYLELHSLKDIVHHKLIPYILFEKLNILNYYYHDNPEFQAMYYMQPVKKIETFDCELVLVKNSDEVQGCIVNADEGRMLSSSHYSGGHCWILSLVEEPITPGYLAIIFNIA
ncbi:hypothetical protein TSAR_016386 [Trichomalopsis sarcophagae]|uniref:Uncharacterized protein n=1 Tax=Trichomalopsis sarcophagae TaxID=543379 RepID=A0A232FBV9_9HYME|nr:hypothetical protein TSAR_016386 [Trichomalopsis sarcophagae]